MFFLLKLQIKPTSLLKSWWIACLYLWCLPATAQEIGCAIAPAPKPLLITQPDGSLIKIVAKGNPFLHWAETTDGYTVVKNPQGIYEYAVKEQGMLKASGIPAVDPGFIPPQARWVAPNIEKHLKPVPTPEAFQQMRSLQPAASHGARMQAKPDMPASGNLRVLCILIEYPDLKHNHAPEKFVQLLNGPLSDGRLSFSEFYRQSSFGKLNIKVDVAGWFQAKQKHTAYASNAQTKGLVAEAIEAADKSGVDFTQYDNDKDGNVDGLIIVHAGVGGEEEASSQYIWSHMSYVFGQQVDGVSVSPYCINPEVRNGGYGKNGMVGMGIFAHEFGHLLGLPDLYDTYGNGEGIGEWGLMGSGGWLGMENIPAGFSAWSKEKLAWVQPKDITEEFKTFSLNPASETGEVYKIRTANPKEYFLVENRQQVGLDQALNGHGLAVWHINTEQTDLYPDYNTVNADADNKGVMLEEADGERDLDYGYNRGDNTDLYPSYKGYTLLDYSTDPNSNFSKKYKSKVYTGVSIGEIQENGQTAQFVYRREMPDDGQDCENPAIAVAGENRTPKLNYFFRYTMPRDGTVSVTVNDPTLAVGGALYRNCQEVESGRAGESFDLDGGSQSYNTFKVDFARKGEQLIFFWEYNLKSDMGGEEAFSWNLSVETGGVAAQDSLALVAMYNTMGGKQWSSKKNWLTKPVSSWEGVTVANGRVSGLMLSDLQNSFPEAFYALDGLQTLELSSTDSLTGSLDDRMAAFKKLKSLYFDVVGLEIDFIDKLDGSFPALTNVDINVYKINGELPATIDAMAVLENLTIRATLFKSQIPENIGKLPKLISLTLNGECYGAIPEALGQAKSLRFIDLAFNKLTGTIPASLALLNNLEYVDVSNNQLTGSLPSGLFTLPSLYALYANNNLLEAIPENIFSSASLEYVELSHNQIKGSLPESVSDKVPVDAYVYLNNNLLSGKVPASLKNIYFNYLDLSYNQLEGPLPEITYTEGLNISHNRFTGLPDLTDGADVYFKALYCQHNHLSFDDLLPNLSILLCPDCEYDDEVAFDEYQQFRPQDTVKLNVTQALATGSSYTIELGIDEQVKDNQYRWFKDNKLFTTTKINKLTVDNFSAAQEGSYRCEVSNAAFEDFTLYYEGITLKLKNNKQDQSIAFASVSNKVYGDPAFKLQTESTGLKDIKFEVVEGPVALLADSVKIQGTGKARIRAYSEGNEQFNPAEAFMEFTIGKAAQTITYEAAAGKSFSDSSFLLNINASSQLPLTLTLKEGQVALNGREVSILGAGQVKILAEQEGSANFQAADPVEISFEIARASQTLTVADIEDQIYGVPAFVVEASSSRQLPLQWEALTPNISVEAGVITVLQAGEAQLSVSQEGNTDIEAADPVVKTFTIRKAPQTLYFQRIDDRLTTDEPFMLEAFSSEGLPVTYKIIDGADNITLENNQVSILRDGSVQIEASQEGTENYEPAIPMQRGFTIMNPGKLLQTLSIQSIIPDTVRVQDRYPFQVEASSGLVPEITIPEGTAQLQGEEIVFLKEGTARVIIKQNGNDRYNSSPTIIKDFVVRPAALAQTITATVIEDKVYGDAPFTIDLQASSGLPVDIQVEGPVSLSGNTLTINGTGTVQLTYSQPGNEDYQPVEKTLTFEIKKAPQTIALEVVPLNDTTFYLSGKSSASLPVAYQVTEGVGKIQNDTLYALKGGKLTVVATQPGNENHHPAEPVSRSVEVQVVTGIGEGIVYEFKVYPNPSQGRVFVQTGGGAKPAMVQVYSAEGRFILEQSWQQETLEIDLSGKPQGVYFVRFVYQGKRYSLPVIIQ